MEQTLYPDILNIIYTFLDKKSLIKYDTANTNKKNRHTMLYTLQKYYNYQMSTCTWTIIRGIKFIYQTCKIKYIKHISPICKYLTIHGQGEINVYNDIIESLYIDMYSNSYIIKDIVCKNLKKLTIVFAKLGAINEDLLNYLENKCPKLEQITFIKCQGVDLVKKDIKVKII